MSEYQYYEFVAIDQPLTKKDMAELRSRSSRATITATSFVNDYQWGNLKGDPADWIRRYFDAYVYTANWYTCQFSLRLPHAVFTKAALKQYATADALTIKDASTHWIINWTLNEGQDDERFGMEDGQGWMGRLLPLRDELLRGDLRPLYLGWLAGVSTWEVDDEAMEPEVPPGMSQLSAAQQALVKFLEIDPDLIAAAAVGSPTATTLHDADTNAWLAQLATNEMRAALKLIVQDQSQQAERRIKSQFLAWQKQNRKNKTVPAKQRTVAQLRWIADEAEQHRLARDKKTQAQQDAKHRKERDAYLRTLAADFKHCWNAIEQLAHRGTASGYDDATRALVDLVDAYALVSNRRTFDKALSDLMERHAKRSALIRRLIKAGMWHKQ